MNRLRLLMRCNTLQIENEILKDSIKEELYKRFREDMNMELTNERLKKENTRLRVKVKELKEELYKRSKNGKK